MASSLPNVSPTLQALIEKGLFDRLPVTFSAYSFDQMKDWHLLFPAEHSYFERLFTLLDRSDPQQVKQLFAPMRDIEIKMGVNDKTWPPRQFTLDQVDFLNRNPHYPEWRRSVSNVFAYLDPALDSEVARAGRASLVIVIAPAELPVGPDRMWTRIERHGKRVKLEPPQEVEQFIPLLLTGEPRHKAAPSLVEISAASKKAGAYRSWIIEAESGISTLGADSRRVTKYSYALLDAYRKRLMQEVNSIVQKQ